MDVKTMMFDVLAKDHASKVFGGIGKSTDNTTKSFGGMRSMLGKVAVGFAGLQVVQKATAFLKDSTAEAREAQKVGALTAQVIKTTGGAAKISAAQVGELSAAISNKTGIDDEAIQSGANLLLTFKNLRNESGKGNDIFNQTTQIMTDMGAAMGKEPKAAAIALGKALNDPIKGVTALSKVGVTFDESQKKLIKRLVETGDVAGAQKIILKELRSEFGGAAAASATSGEKAAVAWGNLKEQIGTALLPTIDKIQEKFSNDVVPAISKFVDEVQTGEGAGGRFADAVKKIGANALMTAKWLNQHRVVIVALAGAYITYRAIVLAAAIAENGATAITAIATAARWANTASVAANNSLLVTWIGVKAIEAAAWIRNAAAAVASTAAMIAASAATKAMAATQWLLNAALAANPIGLVVLALVAIGAALVIAYRKSETFRSVVQAAMRAVGAVVTWLWNHAYAPAMRGIVTAIGWVLTAIGKMLSALGKIPGFGWAKTAGDKMQAAGRAARTLAQNIRNIPSKKRVDILTVYTQANNDSRRGPAGVTSRIGRNARGTHFWRGGWTFLNEEGPELVNLPRGSQVMPASRSAAATAGGGDISVTAPVVLQMDTRQVWRGLLTFKRVNGNITLGLN